MEETSLKGMFVGIDEGEEYPFICKCGFLVEVDEDGHELETAIDVDENSRWWITGESLIEALDETYGDGRIWLNDSLGKAYIVLDVDDFCNSFEFPSKEGLDSKQV